MITENDVGCRVLLKTYSYSFTSLPQSGNILEVATDYFNIRWDNGNTCWCKITEYQLLDYLESSTLLCEKINNGN
jgi:hypothetical protein